jgi:hypothetical protein
VGTLVSLAIGLAIGYLSVRLGDLGELMMALLLALLLAYYLRAGRLASASAVAIGAGAAVALLLGRVILNTMTDPAVHVEAPTYIGFALGLLVTVSGLAIGIVAMTRRA